jgi:sec-independent protein translocase protein TatB
MRIPGVLRQRSPMFSVPHLIIIFAVALMVFGPEKLPELARTLGKVMGEFRRATGDLRSTFEGHMRDLEREAELRRVREAQPPTQTIGGGTPAPALPVSAPESASEDPLPPAPGTVSTEPPNSIAARDVPDPKQLQFEAHELTSSGQPAQAPAADVPATETDPEKASDGRARPA